MVKYSVTLHSETYNKVKTNLTKLKQKPGVYLQKYLHDQDLSKLDPQKYLELLMQTKIPQIFAESSVHGDGSDWTQIELQILGDISICMPVEIYDDGKHFSPNIHEKPFNGYLLYTPGALLRNGQNNTPTDYEEIIKGDKINSPAYCELYKRRLLPVFTYANNICKNTQQQAFITIPGLGCGQFAGSFMGKLGLELQKALIELLQNHGDKFPNIKAVYYDPYRECENERHEINGISFFVRPLVKGNENKPQLCSPETYEEQDDNFSDCKLFSVVAWDHVSWPGNDFYIGSRSTDDGVKAAATNTMEVMTGVKGKYNMSQNKYNPPSKYRTWNEVAINRKIVINKNLIVI
ncbi:hypothetical protein [Candidatus Uabimicrobium sp. HlEnr_7]|uniref:hypothetical protein n=1 Tax=Candidatus Uabimicrobium helgolandensis TaxID=3095367 RepID=UPI003558E31B